MVKFSPSSSIFCFVWSQSTITLSSVSLCNSQNSLVSLCFIPVKFRWSKFLTFLVSRNFSCRLKDSIFSTFADTLFSRVPFFSVFLKHSNHFQNFFSLYVNILTVFLIWYRNFKTYMRNHSFCFPFSLPPQLSCVWEHDYGD